MVSFAYVAVAVKVTGSPTFVGLVIEESSAVCPPAVKAGIWSSTKNGVPGSPAPCEEEEQDGVVRMLPFTHETLAQYVGTSREIVTHWMARLKRDGCIRYSRRGIMLSREKLRNWMESAPKDVAPPEVESAASG